MEFTLSERVAAFLVDASKANKPDDHLLGPEAADFTPYGWETGKCADDTIKRTGPSRQDLECRFFA